MYVEPRIDFLPKPMRKLVKLFTMRSRQLRTLDLQAESSEA